MVMAEKESGQHQKIQKRLHIFIYCIEGAFVCLDESVEGPVGINQTGR